MICIKVEIPEEIFKIDDELKAIYHSRDTVCIWIFKTRTERNRFMDETFGMMKDERENHYEKFFPEPLKKLNQTRLKNAIWTLLRKIPYPFIES